MKYNKMLVFNILCVLLLPMAACQNAASQEKNAAEQPEIVEINPPEASEPPVAYAAAPRLEEAFTLEYLMGKFNPAEHPDFVRIAPPYADNNERFLRKDAYDAFRQMHAAALRDGIRLTIISATRNFEAQKGIWEAKWTGARLVDGADLSKTIADPRRRALKILEYSSMPGTSRHHWGTDIDINNLNDAHFLTGEGKKTYEWLRAHAHEYGYCQPYSPQGAERPYGYFEEKWHWSYLPVARTLTCLAQEQLRDELITGFKGAEAAPSIGVVAKYVLGINQECLPAQE